MEIRKHKWIESEKRKKEIGLATAALDWIKKYGHTWKLTRLKSSQEINIFLKKRQYQRFDINLPVEIIFDNVVIKTSSENMSLLDVSYETRFCLENISSIEVRIIFPRKRLQKKFASRRKFFDHLKRIQHLSNSFIKPLSCLINV